MKSIRQNDSIKAINDVSTLRNELRSDLSREEINRIIEKLYKKEVVYNYLKEKEQNESLTNKEKKVLKNIDSAHLKNLRKHFKISQKYQYGIDYLFNEHNEEDYSFKKARNFLNEGRSNLSRKE